MLIEALAHCAQVEQSAEVAQLVGDGKYMTTGELAAMLSVSRTHVIHLIDTGQLPGTRTGSHRRVLRTVAEAYAKKVAKEAGGE